MRRQLTIRERRVRRVFSADDGDDDDEEEEDEEEEKKHDEDEEEEEEEEPVWTLPPVMANDVRSSDVFIWRGGNQ